MQSMVDMSRKFHVSWETYLRFDAYVAQKIKLWIR